MYVPLAFSFTFLSHDFFLHKRFSSFERRWKNDDDMTKGQTQTKSKNHRKSVINESHATTKNDTTIKYSAAR